MPVSAPVPSLPPFRCTASTRTSSRPPACGRSPQQCGRQVLLSHAPRQPGCSPLLAYYRLQTASGRSSSTRGRCSSMPGRPPSTAGAPTTARPGCLLAVVLTKWCSPSGAHPAHCQCLVPHLSLTALGGVGSAPATCARDVIFGGVFAGTRSFAARKGGAAAGGGGGPPKSFAVDMGAAALATIFRWAAARAPRPDSFRELCKDRQGSGDSAHTSTFKCFALVPPPNPPLRPLESACRQAPGTCRWFGLSGSQCHSPYIFLAAHRSTSSGTSR